MKTKTANQKKVTKAIAPKNAQKPAKEEKAEKKAAPAPEPSPASEASKDKNLKPASWLVARLRNALHQTRPDLKESKALRGVYSLSDIRGALAMSREEWEALLERFFLLGGKLEEKEA